jgi:hypothetical protein
MMGPLTPPECDLRGLPFMPLDTVRLGDSDLVALSTGEEFKAAVILWCKAWVQVPAASLPDDDRVLAHLTGIGPRWKKVREMALHGWVKCSDGRLYHPVIAEKALEAWKHRQSQRDRANKRWQNHGKANGDATGYAVASAAVMQGTGTVKEEEKKEEKQPPAAAPYVFAGKVIHLTQADFDQWARAYPALDLQARLQSRDDWLATEADERTKKRWFIATSNYLANLQQEAAQLERQGGGVSVPC